MKNRWIALSAIAVTAAMAGPFAENFYKGSQVSILTGSGAGHSG